MRDRYVGCMVGLAVGDALGGPTEFYSYEEIRQRWPPDGVSDFVGFRGLPPGSYTDDTEMAISAAERILKAKGREVDQILDSIAEEFKMWYVGMEPARSPGTTSTASVRNLVNGVHWSKSGINDSKGCGSAMRSQPIGLAFHDDEKMLVEIASKSSLMTHGHPVATASAIGTAFLVSKALNDTPVLDALDDLLALTQGISDEFIETMRYVYKAIDIEDPADLQRLIGQGWTGDEALAWAIRSVARWPDSYDRVVLEAANSGGDADSKACIAGAIAGAYLGVESIPLSWRERVESRDLLVQLGEDLLEYSLRQR